LHSDGLQGDEMATAHASGEWITLAVVIKTQGRFGEVAVELHTDAPDRFQQDMRLCALIGAELQLPRSERAQLEPGWTYLSDLIGCVVFDGQREIGQIEDVQFGSGEAPLLVVRGEQQRRGAQLPYEIPFAEAWLEKLDVERKQVRMRLPEGLLEVNAPLGKQDKQGKEGKAQK
jgi:16S rRNA processing protein RimM